MFNYVNGQQQQLQLGARRSRTHWNQLFAPPLVGLVLGNNAQGAFALLGVNVCLDTRPLCRGLTVIDCAGAQAHVADNRVVAV